MTDGQDTEQPLSFTDIIRRWDNLKSFCADVGVPDPTARAWINRDRIPSHHWVTIIEAARARGIALDLGDFTAALALSQQRRMRTPASDTSDHSSTPRRQRPSRLVQCAR